VDAQLSLHRLHLCAIDDPYERLDAVLGIAKEVAQRVLGTRAPGGAPFRLPGHRQRQREANDIDNARVTVLSVIQGGVVSAQAWRAVLKLGHRLRGTGHTPLPAITGSQSAYSRAYLCAWCDAALEAARERRALVRAERTTARMDNADRLIRRMRSTATTPGSGVLRRALGRVNITEKLWGLQSDVAEAVHIRWRGTRYDLYAPHLGCMRWQGPSPAPFLRRLALHCDRSAHIDHLPLNHMSIRFSALHHVSDFLCLWDHVQSGPTSRSVDRIRIRLVPSAPRVLTAPADIHAAEECYYAQEGADTGSICPHCFDSRHPLVPIPAPVCDSSTGSTVRRARFWCSTCMHSCIEPALQAPPPCPIPAEVWEQERRIPVNTPPVLVESIAPDDLFQYLDRLRLRKAGGKDGIPYELLRYGPDDLRQCVLTAVNHALETGDVPESWNGGMVRLLLKRYPVTQITNWRPVCLLRTVYKIVSAIVNDRLAQLFADYQILEEQQEGNQPGHSTKRQAMRLLRTATYSGWTPEWSHTIPALHRLDERLQRRQPSRPLPSTPLVRSP